MKKKVIGIIMATVTVILLAACLVACNPYKWSGIGGGDKDADVISNGGYVVQQGRYIYFINGYEGTGGENNEWGTPVKQSIVRAEVDKDGNVNNKTCKVVVPKIIYNSSKNGGFAIYGEWIYYATPNNDKDKTGTASTTDTDFMRTKIDGSATQRLGKIASRSAEYLFTSSRIWYYVSNTLSYLDFSGVKSNKSFDNAKDVVSGDFATGVTSVAWDIECDTICYTQNVTGDDSYKNYNELFSVKTNGADKTKLATIDTFLSDGETYENTPSKVFKYTVKAVYKEAEGASVYYTKTFRSGSSDTNVGLFVAKTSAIKEEKQLTSLNPSTLYPLGYDNGALAYNNSNAYVWYNDGKETQVTDASKTIWKVDGEYAYFTASSSASELMKIKYKEAVPTDNATTVITESMKVDWLKLDFVGDKLYFFKTDDSNLLHSVNVKTFNAKDEEAKSDYVGFEREEDKEEEK